MSQSTTETGDEQEFDRHICYLLLERGDGIEQDVKEVATHWDRGLYLLTHGRCYIDLPLSITGVMGTASALTQNEFGTHGTMPDVMVAVESESDRFAGHVVDHQKSVTRRVLGLVHCTHGFSRSNGGFI